MLTTGSLEDVNEKNETDNVNTKLKKNVVVNVSPKHNMKSDPEINNQKN